MRHVLVIEDEYLMAVCIADMVMYAGASSVEIADSADAAVQAARRHHPSIIVSDVDLKEGGRGPDAVALIHTLCGSVPTIFVTGDTGDEQACTLGTAILTKPISAHSFASTFRAISAEASSWREAVATEDTASCGAA